MLELLIALASVILLGQLLGRLLARLHQPPVIGEIAAGIALGPSLLGWLHAGLQQTLIPLSVLPSLGVAAQLGVVLYMFVVGLELDAGAVRRHLRSAIALSCASIIVPLINGAALALVLYPHLSSMDVSRIRSS